MKLFATGDTHGNFERFRPEYFPEGRGLTKEDAVLILGDFGGVWFGDDRDDEALDWLEGLPFTVAFVSGNHENYDLLDALPAERWNGGLVQRVRPSVLHLMRGQTFHIGGLRVFSMGGAASHDIADGILEPDDPLFKAKKRKLDARRAMYRVNHRSWWARELPSDAEYEQAERSLNACGREVDLIVTHCAPTFLASRAAYGQAVPDRLTDYLETVANSCRFSFWCFGHYHDNRTFDGKYTLLYEQIAALPSMRQIEEAGKREDS